MSNGAGNNLTIRDLRVKIEGEDKEILKGINLTVEAGKIHAIMGPNGSGKSTLAYTLAGHPRYEVTGGEAIYHEANILELEPEERSKAGIFLAFQYPVAVAGVTVANFLRAAVNAHRAQPGKDPKTTAMPIAEFRKTMQQQMQTAGDVARLRPPLPQRGLFGRREKAPRNFADGDAQALNGDHGRDRTRASTSTRCGIVANGVNAVKANNPELGVLVITHYQRLLNYIKPDRVHVLMDGLIVREGGPELALELEEKGYDFIREEVFGNASA